MAIPCMLPIPAAGIIPQSFPTVAADSAMDADGEAAACGEAAALWLAVLPYAAAPIASPRATIGITAARPRRTTYLSVGCIASPCVARFCCLSGTPAWPARCRPDNGNYRQLKRQGTARRPLSLADDQRVVLRARVTVVTRRRHGCGLPVRPGIPRADQSDTESVAKLHDR